MESLTWEVGKLLHHLSHPLSLPKFRLENMLGHPDGPGAQYFYAMGGSTCVAEECGGADGGQRIQLATPDHEMIQFNSCEIKRLCNSLRSGSIAPHLFRNDVIAHK